VKGKVKSIVTIVFDIKEIILPGRLNSHFRILRESIRRHRPELLRQKGCWIMIMHKFTHHFHQEMFDQNNVAFVTPPSFLCFPIEDKPEGLPF
jgi:hypothetical protein